MPPVALPPAVTDKLSIRGYARQQWIPRPLGPGEVVALQQALVELDARLRRAGEGRTLFHVMRLLNNWKDTRSGQEKEWMFDDWAEDLEEFSEAHLRESCKAWRQNNSYPPKVADIRGLCIQARTRDAELNRRCRVLLRLEEPRPAEKQARKVADNEVQMAAAGVTDTIRTMQAEPPRALPHQHGASLGEILATGNPTAVAAPRNTTTKKQASK